MTDKPRKSKRPKAMRVTTDASKAKLPRPKRKNPSGVTPSPIAGQPLDAIGTDPAPDFRAIPCGEDVQMFVSTHTGDVVLGSARLIELAFPDTEPYPWPVRWGLAVTRWVERLARRVMP